MVFMKGNGRAMCAGGDVKGKGNEKVSTGDDSYQLFSPM
jgi:enoyl-CoA hydratase/carnithine racemase